MSIPFVRINRKLAQFVSLLNPLIQTCSIVGGGILDLDIKTILQVEGVIASNGATGYSTNIAGGSGGFIRVHVRDLDGSGSIEVSGGAGASNTGAGGGGRIAIYYKSTKFWFGSFVAKGGSGSFGIGGAGTVYLKVSRCLLFT